MKIDVTTTKATPKTIKNVRKIAAETGERQYQVMERLSESELKAINMAKTGQIAKNEGIHPDKKQALKTS